MALTAIKTSTGTIVEGTDAVGKPVELFYDSVETMNYDRLVEAEDSFRKQSEFERQRAALPDPERDLYLSIFGAGQENTDTVLHTTLVEAVEARNGIAIDWTQNPVTAVLRLINTGHSDRLRLIAGSLVDMGPTPATGGSSSVGVEPVGPSDSGDSSPVEGSREVPVAGSFIG